MFEKISSKLCDSPPSVHEPILQLAVEIVEELVGFESTVAVEAVTQGLDTQTRGVGAIGNPEFDLVFDHRLMIRLGDARP